MRVACVLALAACGRLGFDAHTGDGAGSSSGTPITIALPDGGQIDFIQATNSTAWYAVTHRGAVYRSDDHATWIACAPHYATQITTLDTGMVYAGGNDVAVSMDKCASWMPLPTGRYAYGIGSYNSVIYALLDNGLRSLNGSTWMSIATPLDGAVFKAWAAHVGSPALIGTGNGLLHSADLSTWTSVTSFPSANIVDVATSPTKTYAISAASGASSGQISCSDGAAQTWSTCFAGGGTSIAVDPNNDQHAFAAVYDNLLETQDAFASETFEQRGGAMGYAAVHTIRVIGSGEVVATTDRGVYTAAPGTVSWQEAFAGIDAWTVNDIAVAGDEVYIATTGGVLHGTRGQPYTHSFNGMTPNTINNAVVVAPDGTAIAAGRNVWISSDHGATWAPMVILGGADGYRAYSAYVDGTRVWVGTQDSIFVADAPYAAWTPHVLGHRVNAFVRTGTRLWAAFDNGLAYSDDDAVTWTNVAAVSSYAESLAVLPDGSLAVGTSAGVSISDPTRTTWTSRGPSTGDVRRLVVVSGALVAATGSGIFASHDGGVTWTGGLAGGTNTVIVDTDGELVVGTDGASLARTPVP